MGLPSVSDFDTKARLVFSLLNSACSISESDSLVQGSKRMRNKLWLALDIHLWFGKIQNEQESSAVRQSAANRKHMLIIWPNIAYSRVKHMVISI